MIAAELRALAGALTTERSVSHRPFLDACDQAAAYLRQQAEAQHDPLLIAALGALQYHRELTRAIPVSDVVIDAIKARLAR